MRVETSGRRAPPSTAKIGVLAVLQVLALPFIVVTVLPVYAAHRARNDIQEYRHWRRSWPKPPSSLFRREIETLGTGEALQCGLFAKLPYEIRSQIYGYLVEDKATHLARYSSSHYSSSQYGYYPGLRHRGINGHTLANFLRTCRHIYAEVTYLLYTTKTFKVEGLQDIASFACFSRSISPDSLASIKKLSVSIQAWKSITYSAKQIRKAHPLMFSKQRFRYPYGSVIDPHRHHPWRKLWSIVAQQLRGLEHLTLVLDEAWPSRVQKSGCVIGSDLHNHKELSLVPEIDEEWVHPLLALRGLKSFKLDFQVESPDAAFLECVAVLEQTIRDRICSADYRKPRDNGGREGLQPQESHEMNACLPHASSAAGVLKSSRPSNEVEEFRTTFVTDLGASRSDHPFLEWS